MAKALAFIGMLTFTLGCSVQGGTPSPSHSTPVPGVLRRPATPIVLPAAATLSAPSHFVVWALVVGQDSYLYRSTDRGSNWQQRPLPPVMGITPEISFVSDSDGWLAVHGSPETQCNTQSVQLWHTTDAGGTWQLLAERGLADSQCKSGLSFVDSTHGFITASDDNHRSVIYFTRDGGLSWSASAALADPPGFTSQPAGRELKAGRALRLGIALLVPVYGYLSASQVQYVFESSDSGASWAYQAAATDSGGALAFISATHWLQLIAPGQSVETTDSGNSWHPSTSDYSQAAPVAPEIDFADGQVGYATVRGSIQLTVDGGHHWTYIRTPGT